MEQSAEEKTLHDAFEIGVLLKGLDGLIEFAGGIVLFFISPGTIENIFLFFARGELTEDPHDVVANYFLHLVQGVAATQSFYSWLLIIHGAVKIFFVAGLLKKKAWAYPSAIIAFTAFVVYQFYQLTFGYSWLILILTLIDIAVIALTAHEYRERRRAGIA